MWCDAMRCDVLSICCYQGAVGRSDERGGLLFLYLHSLPCRTIQPIERVEGAEIALLLYDTPQYTALHCTFIFLRIPLSPKYNVCIHLLLCAICAADSTVQYRIDQNCTPSRLIMFRIALTFDWIDLCRTLSRSHSNPPVRLETRIQESMLSDSRLHTSLHCTPHYLLSRHNLPSHTLTAHHSLPQY